MNTKIIFSTIIGIVLVSSIFAVGSLNTTNVYAEKEKECDHKDNYAKCPESKNKNKDNPLGGSNNGKHGPN